MQEKPPSPQQAFTIPSGSKYDNRQGSNYAPVRSSSVFKGGDPSKYGLEPYATKSAQSRELYEEKKRKAKSDKKWKKSGRKGSEPKFRKPSAKRHIESEESDECLHIDFAELLEPPVNKYFPSLHGWREWSPRKEWIDPDEARAEAVNAIEEYMQTLPPRRIGPPLP